MSSDCSDKWAKLTLSVCSSSQSHLGISSEQEARPKPQLPSSAYTDQTTYVSVTPLATVGENQLWIHCSFHGPVGHRARDCSHAESHRGGTTQSRFERKSRVCRLLQGVQPTSHTHRVLHCCGPTSRRGRLLLEFFILPTVSLLSPRPNREISQTHAQLQSSWNVCRQEHHGHWSVETPSFQKQD